MFEALGIYPIGMPYNFAQFATTNGMEALMASSVSIGSTSAHISKHKIIVSYSLSSCAKDHNSQDAQNR